MGTGLVILMLLAVLVGAYSLQLRTLHRVAEQNHQRALMSERVFSESFHASPMPLALMCLETHRITEVNGAYVRMLGWSREELLTKTAVELAIQNSSELITRTRRLRRNGVLRDYTSSLTCKDGSTREVLISMDMIAIDDVPHSLTTIIDQTEHRRALAELQSTDQRLRELAENVDEVFWVSAPDRSQMHYVSPAYAKIWGRTVESMYADPASWLEAVLPEDRARLALDRQQREYRIRRPDGTIRWIRAKSFPVRDGNGTVIRLAGVERDVTEQRSLEEQLRQAQKMESLGMLAGGIAHDFNNLLAVISSCGGLLAESLGRAHPDAELVDDIADAVVRATQLTRQLLAFSRKQVTEPVVLDPNGIVTDTRKLVRRMVGVNVEVITSLEPELRPGHGRSAPDAETPVEDLVEDDDDEDGELDGLDPHAAHDVHDQSERRRATAESVASANFDLLLTDIVMPGMSGRVLAEAAQARFPDLKVLMMTGYTDDEVVRSGVASGQVDLIEKPFTIAALAAKVRAVLDVEPMAPPEELPASPTALALN